MTPDAPIRWRRHRFRALPVLLLCLVLAGMPAGLRGQSGEGAAVPSPEEFLGYSPGAAFTDHASVREYLSLLGGAPSARYRAYGRSVEGRELIQLVIGRPDRLVHLDSVLDLNAELTRVGTNELRAREIVRTNPAVVYFSYGVHGNESSSTEAALWTAYDLVSGLTDLTDVLDSLVVVIDPAANPDGRDRYVQWYRSVVGARPNPEPQSREHREPWPGGRYNHYLFDLNRDWAWMTQPETRARLATWWAWNPQVHVDFHEMSPNSSYFFFPASPPINPVYPGHVLDWGRRFGSANAEVFDAKGWRYFTGENFDMLYPGYGDSWPSLHGAIGMTYEQAGGGSAGLAYRRTDGDTLTLLDRLSRHRVAAATTLRVAAAGRTRLLTDFATSHRTAGESHPDVLLVPGERSERLDALVKHLFAQGIEVEVAISGFNARSQPYPGYLQRSSFPVGTVRVRARQPRGRLAITLLQPETEVLAEYSYDITAWSLPYAYGVEAHQTRADPEAGWRLATIDPPISAPPLPSTIGYLVPPGERVTAAMLRYLRSGGEAHVLGEPSIFDGRTWPSGTWFIPAAEEPRFRPLLDDATFAVQAAAVGRSLSEGGPDLGSESVRAVRLPRVGVLTGEGVSPPAYGAIWYFLEQEVMLPFDALLLAEIPRTDLSGYDVLILPDLQGSLSQEVRDNLQEWVEFGGRLIASSTGASAVAPIAEVEIRPRPADSIPEGRDSLDVLLMTREQRERREWEESVPGAILQVNLDPRHPIAWGATSDGVPGRLFVLHSGGPVFEPRGEAEAVASFPVGLERTSGSISDENLRRLERSAWLITRPVGRGQVILFADDPLFRLFWRATRPLFLNAILFGGA